MCQRKKVDEVSCCPWSRKYSMENRGKCLWKSSLGTWNGSGVASSLLLQLWEISCSEPYTSGSVNKSLRIIYSCCVCRLFFFCHHIGRADSFRKRHSLSFSNILTNDHLRRIHFFFLTRQNLGCLIYYKLLLGQ